MILPARLADEAAEEVDANRCREALFEDAELEVSLLIAEITFAPKRCPVPGTIGRRATRSRVALIQRVHVHARGLLVRSPRGFCGLNRHV